MVLPYNGCFFIKSGMKGRIVRVNVSEILYIESALNYILIHSEYDKQITYLTLWEIEAVLVPRIFLRVHKSFIVNLRQIKAIEGSMIIMNDKNVVPLGEKYRERFYETLNQMMVVSNRFK